MVRQGQTMNKGFDKAGTERQHRVVSADSEELILVNTDDSETGYLDKGRCHDGEGILHRAFSVFIFNDVGELLLQQRAADKRLWPLYWSNSCCSHPRRGESMHLATRRRLADELNIQIDLEFVYKFAYQARFGDAGSENELCSVYLGQCDQKVRANQTEVAALRYSGASALAKEFATSPDAFTPWFKMEWERLSTDFRQSLSKYSDIS
jgi:isopentenyl-diphosphate delta-isomerase